VVQRWYALHFFNHFTVFTDQQFDVVYAELSFQSTTMSTGLFDTPHSISFQQVLAAAENEEQTLQGRKFQGALPFYLFLLGTLGSYWKNTDLINNIESELRFPFYLLLLIWAASNLFCLFDKSWREVFRLKHFSKFVQAAMTASNIFLLCLTLYLHIQTTSYESVISKFPAELIIFSALHPILLLNAYPNLSWRMVISSHMLHSLCVIIIILFFSQLQFAVYTFFVFYTMSLSIVIVISLRQNFVDSFSYLQKIEYKLKQDQEFEIAQVIRPMISGIAHDLKTVSFLSKILISSLY
jgi:heme exporter protein D